MQINLLDKDKSGFGFTAGHFMLIAGCLVALLGFAIMKGDVTWATFNHLPLIHAAAPQQNELTFDAALAQAKKDMGYDQLVAGQSSIIAAQQKDDISQIDASSAAGEVLGASTDPMPTVDQLFTQDKLNAISVTTTPTTNHATATAYFDAVSNVEITYNAPVLLSAFATQDPTILNQTHAAYLQIISDMRSIPVPQGLVTYHKMKLIYYSTLAGLADSMASGDSGRSDAILAGNLYFQLSDQVDQMQTQLKGQYQVD